MATNPDLVKKAIEEAYASAPADVIILDTLEILIPNHDSIRIVRWPISNQEITKFQLLLEDTAPMNPNKVTEFLGIPFEILLPEQNSGGDGTFSFKIDNINNEMEQIMIAAVESNTIVNCIYREYIKGQELDGPGTVWVGIELTNPRLEGMSFVIDGSVLNWTSKAYGKVYRASEYPGLVVGH